MQEQSKVHPQIYHSGGFEICLRVHSYSFGNGGPDAKFQSPRTTLSVRN